MFSFTAVLPLSLYIHFPWCVRKCPYCDFNSHEAKDTIPQDAYCDALIADVEQELPLVWGRPVQSVFIGGGTPSLLEPALLDRLLSDLRARLPLVADAEITMEANPGTVEQGRFAEFRAAGISRLSIGIQSFDDEMLTRIGRIHSGREAVLAAESARQAGFENINLDLMFGLPGQSLEQAMADVERALGLEPAHLSYYQLTIEPNTAFHHSPPLLPDDERIWNIFEGAQARLRDKGYKQYEVSAYSRQGSQCRHNLNYWHFGDYLGIGAGAHGKITDAPNQRIERRWKVRHPREYLRNDGETRIGGRGYLTRQDAALEFMMNALRLSEGFDTALFSARTGLPISEVAEPLRRAESRGLLYWDVNRIEPTEAGRNHLNELLELFVG